MSAQWSKTGEFEGSKEGESLYSGLAGGPGSMRVSAHEPPRSGQDMRSQCYKVSKLALGRQCMHAGL
jgi:hypothetical protein